MDSNRGIKGGSGLGAVLLFLIKAPKRMQKPAAQQIRQCFRFVSHQSCISPLFFKSQAE
jgi:hypothetical protein